MHVTFSFAFPSRYAKTSTSNFCKVMWQHTEGMMGSIIWILLEIYFFFQQWKDFENPLRIDKGIAMSVLLFLGHSLDMLSMVCFNDFTNPPAVNRVIAFTLVIQSSELKFHLWLCPEFGMKLVTHSRDSVISHERPSSLLELTVITGWPLVWKTWKCQGIWQLSGKCQGFYWK